MQQTPGRVDQSAVGLGVGLFGLSLGLGLIAITLGHFEGLYGQDSFAYYNYALGPLRAALLRGEAPPPFFWPLGYPLLAMLASLLAGTRGPQLVSLVAAALVPVFTLGLTVELLAAQGDHGSRSRRVGLLAGLIVALCGLLLQAATVVMSDAAALAWATLGAWALARHARLERRRWLVLAAFALAWSILTRWACALLALPFAAYGLGALLKPAGRPRAPLLGRLVANATTAVLAGLVVLGPEFLLAGLRAAGGAEPAHVGDLQIVGWSPGNALRRSFVTSDGRLSYPLPTGLFYATAVARPVYFTPLLAPAVLAGLWALWRRRAWQPALLLAGWPATVYLFLAGIAWQSLRFTLEFLPPLAILIALGLDELNERLTGRAQTLVRLWAVAGLAVMLSGAVRNVTVFIREMNGNVAAARWVESQVPAGAQVLSFGLTLTLDHYTGLAAEDIYFQTPETLPAILAASRPTFLFVDVASLESQWAGRSPDLAYRWLRDNPGLTEVGRWNRFTLFRVEPCARVDCAY